VGTSDKRLIRAERRADESITIHDYDPSWAVLYQTEHDRIAAALRGIVVDIEHAGSTAVPGLDAKPIIDIMVCVGQLPIAAEHVAALNGLGYEYLGESGIPGRLCFRKRGASSFNLSIVQQDSSLWDDNLLFRDYLQAHPDEARRYGTLKRRLACEEGHSLLLYSDRKARFISQTLERAHASRRAHPNGDGTRPAARPG
jgi:GrpB-like predicted nucleotidyltransferase (UPF0157 family)